MVAMRVHKGPLEADALLDEVPKDQWTHLLIARCLFIKSSIPYDCRELLRFREDAERMWKPMGYSSVNDLLRRGLEIEPQVVKWAITGLKSLKPDEPIPLSIAVDKGRQNAATMARAVPTRAPAPPPRHAGPGRGKKNAGSASTPVFKVRDSSYLAGRIKAKAENDDRARDIQRRVEAGEYTSMRAAARDAGIIKPPDPVKVALRAIAKVPETRLKELRAQAPKAVVVKGVEPVALLIEGLSKQRHRLAELVAKLPPDLRKQLAACLRDAQ